MDQQGEPGAVADLVGDPEAVDRHPDGDVDRALSELALDSAGVGVFDWDLVTGRLNWDQRLLDLFGLDRTGFGGDIAAFNAAVHPDDVDRVGQALSAAIAECGVFESEYRVLLPDGGSRWVRARGEAVPGPDRTAVRLLGAAYDTTAIKEGEARIDRILEAMPSAFFHLDTDWRFTYLNPRAEQLLGAIGTPILGAVIWEAFPAAVGTDFETSYRAAVASGEPVTFEAYYPPPLDDWYEVRAWPVPDGLSVYFHDITGRRTAETALADAHRRAALIAEVTRSLTETLSVAAGAERLAQVVVPALGDWCVVSLVGGEDLAEETWRRRVRDVASCHRDPDARLLLEQYSRTRVGALHRRSFLLRALMTGQPQVVASGATAAILSVLDDGPAQDLCRALAPESLLVVPFRGRGRVIGALTIARGADREPFHHDDLDVALDVAARAGLALDNARAFEQQRDLSAALQRSLLTDPPEPDHLHVAVRYEPATEAAQVGGDWYDSFMQDDGATTVVIGDVLGHDTAAAASMGEVRGLLRGIAVSTGGGPAEVLQRVDGAMAVLGVHTLASAVVARFEQTPEERRAGTTSMRWSNAGHPPPLVAVPYEPAGDGLAPVDPADIPAEGPGPALEVDVRVVTADRNDTLLGLDPDLPRREHVTTLPRGATVLLYTDGLVERRGEHLDVGIDQLRATLAELVREGVPLEDLCDEVLGRLRPTGRDDDIALVAVRLHREDRPRPPEAGPRRVPDAVD